MIKVQYNLGQKNFSMTKEDSNKLIEALKAAHPEVTFYTAKGLSNAYYISARATELINKVANKSENNAKTLARSYRLTVDQVKTISGHCIVLGDSFQVPEIVAHELGHYHNETKGKLSKVTQRNLRTNSKLTRANSKFLRLALIIDPKKTWIAGASELLNQLPKLYYEKRASDKGLKLIKTLSKELKMGNIDIRTMKKTLGNAWATYFFNALTIPLAAVGASSIAHVIDKSNPRIDKRLGVSMGGIIGAQTGRLIADKGYIRAHKNLKKLEKERSTSLPKSEEEVIKKSNLTGLTDREYKSINDIITDFNLKTSNHRSRSKRFSTSEPANFKARPKKPYTVISTIDGDSNNPTKRLSVVTKQARSPKEAEMMVHKMNTGRMNSRYRNIRAFDTSKSSFNADLYRDSLTRDIQYNKQQK